MSKSKTERTLVELYQDDPERADAVVFGRRAEASRRGFLGGAGLAAMGAAVGGSILFADSMPAGLIPAAFAQPAAAPSGQAAAKAPQTLNFPGKDPGSLCSATARSSRRRRSISSTIHTTPIGKFYIRNNGQIPDAHRRA